MKPRHSLSSMCFNVPGKRHARIFLIVCSILSLHPLDAQTPPANDDFANRASLAPGTTRVLANNLDATVESGEPTTLTGYVTTSTVWWEWRSPLTGDVTIDTFGSSFDTTLAVYLGTWGLRVIDNDDSGGDRQSSVTFTATAGTTYLIQVGGNISAPPQIGSQGNIVLNYTMPYPTAVIPGALSASAQAGDSFTLEVLLAHAGPASLDYTVGSTDTWLQPPAAPGVIASGETRMIQIMVGPVPAPPLSGSVTFTFPSSGTSPITVPVDIAVQSLQVNIPDSNLRAAIESSLSIGPGDPITPQQMESLFSFSATSSLISNLQGLEFATSLQILELSGNDISDLTPLGNLVNLEELYLDTNQITDLSPLLNLTELAILDLGDNLITDITALEGLVLLEQLYLDTNQVADISALDDLLFLQELYLDFNQITDVTPLSNLTDLVALLLSDNQITDVSALAGLLFLEELYIDSNFVYDISPLAGLLGLFDLDVTLNYLELGGGSDLQVITDLENTGVFVFASPQRDLFSFNEWLVANGIPSGSSGDSDRNGPLQIPNLLAFGMGLNPFTATLADLPAFSYESATDQFTVRYHRNTRIEGAETTLRASPDLMNWSKAVPIQLSILSDDGNGVQYVEAVFPVPADKVFYQVGTERFILIF